MYIMYLHVHVYTWCSYILIYTVYILYMDMDECSVARGKFRNSLRNEGRSQQVYKHCQQQSNIL